MPDDNAAYVLVSVDSTERCDNCDHLLIEHAVSGCHFEFSDPGPTVCPCLREAYIAPSVTEKN